MEQSHPQSHLEGSDRLVEADEDWGMLWFRIFPTSARTFRTAAKERYVEYVEVASRG